LFRKALTVYDWDLPHGILRLDTTSNVLFIDSVTLDSTEEKTLYYALPSDSTRWIGEELFFQTLIVKDSTDWIYGNIVSMEVDTL
jgi:hypothetical protein